MHNKILFDDNQNNNNDNGNAELLKENTPQTVDYNKLYNIQENNQISSNQTSINTNKNNTNNLTKEENITNNENNISEQSTTVNTKKKGISSLLLVFLVFLIIMGVIIFLFPFIWKATQK